MRTKRTHAHDDAHLAEERGPVGILVVTHGDAGSAMLRTLVGLVGEGATKGFSALTVGPSATRAAVAADVIRAIHRVDLGAGVVILCDLMGSTPWKCCIEIMKSVRNIEVVCGVSMPMLVKLAAADREKTAPKALAAMAAETAARSIRVGEGGQA